MTDDRTPILVGCGQITDRSNNKDGLSPIEMMTAAAQAAIKDGSSAGLADDIDHVIAVGLTVDAVGFKIPLSGDFSNVPKSVANRLGIDPKTLYYTTTGGNTPQYLVNHYAEQIAQGRAGTVLLTGGEALQTMRKRFNHWFKLLLPKGKWREHLGTRAESFGDNRLCGTKHEEAYGLNFPANVYPLFENALRHHYGRSQQEHMRHVGKLFETLTEVAEQNEFAWFQQKRSAEELITPTAQNRIIAYPYTKLLNSMIFVNQAASVVLTSVGRAKALGIPEEKWVYLHGCADANDIWNVTERINFHSSPAMQQAGQEALRMAGKTIDEIDFFDIYSCFPSAVQIACDEFGIAHDDPRGLSQTGGLPYFGGPGNNYSMHAIAQMMITVREHPGKYGLLNANGWFITKHSLGIYSTSPVSGAWRRTDPKDYQQQILDQHGPDFVEQAEGAGRIETFTVVFDKNNEPEKAIIIGRLQTGQRFLATTDNQPGTLQALLNEEVIGRSGKVSRARNKNVFELDA